MLFSSLICLNAIFYGASAVIFFQFCVCPGWETRIAHIINGKVINFAGVGNTHCAHNQRQSD